MPLIQSNHLESYYEVHGEGPAILFIHGLGSSSQDWEFQIEHFAKQYKVILVDVRGHGRSEKTSGRYSIRLFSQDIASLMSELSIDEAHVVGLSMGGMIAFQLALDHPKFVRSMSIVNSGPNFIASDFKTQMKFALRIFLVKFLGLNAVGKKVADGLFPKPEQHELRELFISRFLQNNKSSYLNAMRALVGWDVLDKINKITCPALILTADKDYTSVAMKKSYCEKLINGQLVIIKDSHHALPVEKPKEFNQAVHSFLQSIENPSG